MPGMYISDFRILCDVPIRRVIPLSRYTVVRDAIDRHVVGSDSFSISSGNHNSAL